mmetsp:Transcript_110935/g.293021  ORF Transcript_110935/g.293021 Transcript_110935/m.293021 type:complete len:105 (-) Transcript_110935:121-435(-)
MAAFRALLVLLALPLARSQITSKVCSDRCFTVACAAFDFDCMFNCVETCPKGHLLRGSQQPRLRLGDLDDQTRQRTISQMEEDRHAALVRKEKRSQSGSKHEEQ